MTKVDLSKFIPNLKTVVWVITIVLGTSIATIVTKGKAILDAPEDITELVLEILKQDSIILDLENIVHHYQDVNEMMWELLRDMTDNKDGNIFYEFADDYGIPYEVDIRETAEGLKKAFVGSSMFIVYPTYYGPNGRLYIMLHNSIDQNTYLRRKTE